MYQDIVTRNWVLNFNGIDIGYFPADLFTNLASANQVGWGGSTTTPAGTPSPPMGSGLLPNHKTHSACYFRWVSYKNENQIFYDTRDNVTEAFTDKPNCYGAKFYGYEKDIGSILQFGGPGGQCDN